LVRAITYQPRAKEKMYIYFFALFFPCVAFFFLQ